MTTSPSDLKRSDRPIRCVEFVPGVLFVLERWRYDAAVGLVTACSHVSGDPFVDLRFEILWSHGHLIKYAKKRDECWKGRVLWRP